MTLNMQRVSHLINLMSKLMIQFIKSRIENNILDQCNELMRLNNFKVNFIFTSFEFI